MNKLETAKEKFILDWGIKLWKYFQNIGKHDVTDEFFKIELNNLIELTQEENESLKEITQFAYKLSKAMKKIGSSHVFFIMQQAFDDDYDYMSWEDCEGKWNNIIQLIENAPSPNQEDKP